MSDVIRLILTMMSDFDEAGMQALVDEELRPTRHRSACSSSPSAASCQTTVVRLGGRASDALPHIPLHAQSCPASTKDIPPEFLPGMHPVEPSRRLGTPGSWCRETPGYPA